ncbi:hypothetical protein LTS09_013714 [Friedmanniomyces endolithicus]|nr:hypothetical protein LTS09_013714 [Friedmanniomyces endolithicus]
MPADLSAPLPDNIRPPCPSTAARDSSPAVGLRTQSADHWERAQHSSLLRYPNNYSAGKYPWEAVEVEGVGLWVYWFGGQEFGGGPFGGGGGFLGGDPGLQPLDVSQYCPDWHEPEGGGGGGLGCGPGGGGGGLIQEFKRKRIVTNVQTSGGTYGGGGGGGGGGLSRSDRN